MLERIDAGWLLGDADDSVLLPNRKAPRELSIGQSLRVFVYTDSEDRPVATTEEPLAVVGDFALLEVVDVSRHGAFCAWGLDKDLIVPTKEQHEPLKIGEKVVVAVVLDRDERVMGAARLARFFDKRVRHLKVGQAVRFLVYGQSERGIRVVVEGRHSGMLFRDETFARLDVGDTGRAWITEVRPDGRLDLSLRAPGRSAADDARSVVIAALKAGDGFLALHDGSSPKQIAERLGISKKAFKRAVGGLYKQRKVELTPDGVRWIG